jgi:hypothetical protein
MNLSNVKEFLGGDMINGVDMVLAGTKVKYENAYLSPYLVMKYLIGLGFTELVKGDDNINGWQADCWYYVERKGEIYALEGSGYSGGVKFYKDTDEQ